MYLLSIICYKFMGLLFIFLISIKVYVDYMLLNAKRMMYKSMGRHSDDHMVVGLTFCLSNLGRLTDPTIIIRTVISLQ